MTLHHFTALVFLPRIVRDGLTRGCVPNDPAKYAYGDVQAVNLTADPNHRNQIVWLTDRETVDKTRIRITVDVPDPDLTTFRQFHERFRTRASVLKLLAPYEVRGKWFYVFGVVTPKQFVRVELREGDTYRPLSPGELAELVSRIEAERDRAFEPETVITNGPQRGCPVLCLKDECWMSWLLDGPASKHLAV